LNKTITLQTLGRRPLHYWWINDLDIFIPSDFAHFQHTRIWP